MRINGLHFGNEVIFYGISKRVYFQFFQFSYSIYPVYFLNVTVSQMATQSRLTEI